MTTMVTELYDALIDAGASQDKARAAARAMVEYDQQFRELRAHFDGKFAALDGKFAAIDGKFAAVDARFAIVEGKIAALAADLGAMKWLMGFMFAAQLAMLAKLFIR